MDRVLRRRKVEEDSALPAALRRQSVPSPAPPARQPGCWAPGGKGTPFVFAGNDASAPSSWVACLKVQASPGAEPVVLMTPGGTGGAGLCGRPSCPTGGASSTTRSGSEHRAKSESDRSTRRRRTRVMQAELQSRCTRSRGISSSRGTSTLMAQKFDLRTRRTAGEPTAVAEDLLYFRDLGQSDFSVSTNGTYGLPGRSHVGAPRLVSARRDGGRPGRRSRRTSRFSRLSPDGEKVAVDILDRRTGTTDIALFDLTRGGKPSFVTTDPMADWTPVFSPDGRQLAFASAESGRLTST